MLKLVMWGALALLGLYVWAVLILSVQVENYYLNMGLHTVICVGFLGIEIWAWRNLIEEFIEEY